MRSYIIASRSIGDAFLKSATEHGPFPEVSVGGVISNRVTNPSTATVGCG